MQRIAGLRQKLALPEYRLIQRFFDATQMGDVLSLIRDVNVVARQDLQNSATSRSTTALARMQAKLEWLEVLFISFYATELTQALKKVRVLLPGAVEMVYDNYNALVIGFGPSERPSQAICSIALYPRWVNLYFLAGASLPDPESILKGSGKIVRHIVLKDAADLDQPVVRALFAHAVADADEPFDPRARRRLIIRSVSAKQRPRRR